MHSKIRDKKTTTLASLALLSVLSGCGGGSDSEGLTPNSNTNSWNAGVFASASQFKGQCQASNEKTGCVRGVTKPTFGTMR
ncbi:hypothetical protein [Pseudoalteromonas sp. MIP2626]|uniref:hypothetical protein n=1 Tax=Pseudoalteromonas sp. MIP2626 TaxID=2705464 RepID=UPI00211BA787|nr:hypothetical protein [Pseudoalteromonas sp. MIP2626]